MSAAIEDEKRFREERAEQLRQRDREREPRIRRRAVRRDLAGRDALHITLVERTAAAQDAGAVDAAPAPAITPWQEQQAAMLDAVSRQHAQPAQRTFLALRAELFTELAGERRTKRQAIDSLRRKYEALRAAYLRIAGTTYEGWRQHGPQDHWDEVIAAAADDAVWDRLVERCVCETARAGRSNDV